MADTTTHKSRTDRRMIFKLGGGVATWPAMFDHCSKLKGQRSRSQGHVTYPHQPRCNSVMDSRYLDGNDRRGWLNTWHACYVSRPNKPDVEIWRTICFFDEKIYWKRPQIGSGNMAVSRVRSKKYAIKPLFMAQSPKFPRLIWNRGRGTRRWRQILDRKRKNGRFAHAQ